MPLGRRRNRIDRSLRERGVPPEPQHRERDRAATAGPWDVVDVPDDGVPRVDLGALRLPALPGMELRLEVSPQQQVVGATLVAGDSLLAVAAFAAPRGAGIWDDVRAEIARTAADQGALLEEARGPFGAELVGTVLALVPDQQGQPVQVRLPARFVGVDGPRWFLRATFTGSAGQGGEAAAALEEALRSVVVVRGDDPMPVREPLVLTLPPGVLPQTGGDPAAGGGPDGLAPQA